MAGLDVIIGQINANSKSRIEEIRQKSDAECNRLIDEAKLQAQSRSDEAKDKAKAQVQDIKDRADSTAKLKVRQMLLSYKQELIAATIEKAKEHFYNMPDGEYFDSLAAVVEKFAGGTAGEVCLSDRDLKRLPTDFESRINKIAQQKGGSLKISDKAADIKGGFILKYASVEENCSIAALFDNSYELLVDKLQEVLFSKK